MKDLLAEINAGNVGLALDSWHWWHAGDTAADLLALQGREVVAVDLNDAPAGSWAWRIDNSQVRKGLFGSLAAVWSPALTAATVKEERADLEQRLPAHLDKHHHDQIQGENPIGGAFRAIS